MRMPSMPSTSADLAYSKTRKFTKTNVLLPTTYRSRSWTMEQDRRLLALIQQYGYRWNIIGEIMQDKNGKKCRQRWFNCLDPRLNMKKFSLYETWILFLGVRVLGTRWRAISRLFRGRNQNQVKNQWHTERMNYKVPFFEQKLTEIVRNSLTEVVHEVMEKENNK